MSKKHFITIQNRWASLSSWWPAIPDLAKSFPCTILFCHFHARGNGHREVWTTQRLAQIRTCCKKQQTTMQFVLSHCLVSWSTVPGMSEWCVCEGSWWSANDGKRHSHVLAEPGNQLVAKSALRLKPRVLVNQAHRLQRHLKQDIGALEQFLY